MPSLSISTEAEGRLLFALAWMSQQYLERDGELDHMCMSAGEEAVEVLEKYGFIEPCGRGGKWTEAGLAFLNSPWPGTPGFKGFTIP